MVDVGLVFYQMYHIIYGLRNKSDKFFEEVTFRPYMGPDHWRTVDQIVIKMHNSFFRSDRSLYHPQSEPRTTEHGTWNISLEQLLTPLDFRSLEFGGNADPFLL